MHQWEFCGQFQVFINNKATIETESVKERAVPTFILIILKQKKIHK